ncbi:MAG: cob(I)yrinic acid a,c-diamide adenosyltransferase [Bdellovibrionales bacterium]|nr:cob(I)yrinic acid a,c-diamide adenosyltransferase [Bdellovibrionales bacterium]
MKIYTKGGDSGQTSLFKGERVPKDHLRIRSYGTLDELNASLGVVLSLKPQAPLADRLTRIQAEIFQLGAELATPRDKTLLMETLGEAEIQTLEKEIDEMEKSLKPLKSFILPGGSPISAHLHLARTISRRAEREIVVLHRAEPLRPEVLQYVNRLSDALFVMARFANHQAHVDDIPWVAPPKSG